MKEHAASTFGIIFLALHCSLHLPLTSSGVVRDELTTTEIFDLTGEPDFRSVKLHWEYAHPTTANFYGFQIHYCELQAWGPNRCRSKLLDMISTRESHAAKKDATYSVTIAALRMSTNYSFEVRPLESKHQSNAKLYGKRIIVPTKGFSAKAILCLPDISEVEVSTGPYFGGRIAVESAEDACSISGDASSARDTYTLRINHKSCGSSVNRSTVATFVLVQENLPILTHSTRRFLVLCTFQPETLTVRAGINLPHMGSGSISDTKNAPADSAESNEIGSNEARAFPLTNDANNSRHLKRYEENSHFLLVAMMGMAAIIAIMLSIWWFVPVKRNIQTARNSNISIFSMDSRSAVSSYENYSNSTRDGLSITDADFANIIEEDESPCLEVINCTNAINLSTNDSDQSEA